MSETDSHIHVEQEVLEAGRETRWTEAVATTLAAANTPGATHPH